MSINLTNAPPILPHRAALFVLPVFLLWMLATTYIILPVAISVQPLWLKSAYPHYATEISKTENGKHWKVETSFFNARQAYPHMTLKPQLKIQNKTYIPLKATHTYTIGLPIYWLLVLSTARTVRGNYWETAKTLLSGSIRLMAVVTLLIGLVIYEQIVRIESTGGDLLRAYHAGFVVVPRAPPEWWLHVLKPAIQAATYAVLILLPVLFWVADYRREDADAALDAVT